MSDPSKVDPEARYPFNQISLRQLNEIRDMFRSKGAGWLVVGNVSDTISACSNGNGGAYVNDTIASLTDVPMYYCGGFKTNAERDDIFPHYRKCSNEWTNGRLVCYLAAAGEYSAAISQNLGPWWWVPLLGSLALGIASA